MKNIKYHDNTTGVQYGEDHMLTDNWNPDLDYGNEYVSVYFRVDTKGYGYPDFCFNDANRYAFDKDIEIVFGNLGWSCKEKAHNGTCATYENGASHLYLHPQNFSGVVLKNDVKKVAEALLSATAFELRWVDLYETFYDMDNDTYYTILSEKKEEINAEIIKAAKTTRRNKYISFSGVAQAVSNKFRIKRISEVNKPMGYDMVVDFVSGCIDTLVVKDELSFYRDSSGVPYIRAYNKTELKQKMCS